MNKHSIQHRISVYKSNGGEATRIATAKLLEVFGGMMSHLLGIDVGTSRKKALVISADEAAFSSWTRDCALYTPCLPWAKQDPEDWWQAMNTGNRIANRTSIGVTNGRGGFLPLPVCLVLCAISILMPAFASCAVSASPPSSGNFSVDNSAWDVIQKTAVIIAAIEGARRAFCGIVRSTRMMVEWIPILMGATGAGARAARSYIRQSRGKGGRQRRRRPSRPKN